MSTIGPVSLSSANFRKFADYIGSELGINMNETKASMLQSRLMRRVRVLGLPSLDAYLENLFHSASGEEERIHLIDAVTTNKTDFFHEPEHFHYLMRLLEPRGASRQSTKVRPARFEPGALYVPQGKSRTRWR